MYHSLLKTKHVASALSRFQQTLIIVSYEHASCMVSDAGTNNFGKSQCNSLAKHAMQVVPFVSPYPTIGASGTTVNLLICRQVCHAVIGASDTTGNRLLRSQVCQPITGITIGFHVRDKQETTWPPSKTVTFIEKKSIRRWPATAKMRPKCLLANLRSALFGATPSRDDKPK